MRKHCRIGVSGEKRREGQLEVELWKEQEAWLIRGREGLKERKEVFQMEGKRRQNKTLQDAQCYLHVPNCSVYQHTHTHEHTENSTCNLQIQKNKNIK